MQVSKENIKFTHHLFGFHSFTKDHNFHNFKGDLINAFERELNITLDAFSFGREQVIRTIERDQEIFEIKITPKTLIYKDALPLDQMTINALKFLNYWKSNSDLVKLRLVGIVRHFNIEIVRNSEETELKLMKKFFKERDLGEKYLDYDFGIRFNKKIAENTYNIHLKMSEKTEPEYRLFGLIDFNQVAKTADQAHKDGDIKRIFDTSQSYCENELINMLNT